MLMHQGIGLDQFNAMPRSKAVHALFECCCCVTWAKKVADGRPFETHDDLLAKADVELLAFSQSDLDRVFESCVHCEVSENSVDNLGRVTRRRISRMLGPEGGYPEY
ncbi:2-oxo-4-hydroxy-4-carboxy-5-ureidoimidazoline decarboxylase [Antrihabitans sp. YC2-6]|uniref:2-oxo-4-hydroxy-4-carboxy-5-ureidoimidazoline decarboxylase n=1 Tax=Antrihabitans sp. YC2-6 TaxID=2799498 RepID=UPI0018F42A29|nr:2-oxo-4-hydroxy-4-carboxy-5-ureidoimidazoline decarboxylase [Antrihabitans sp. YC2-6]MBJ8345999.1 OHCU decarboxylase [Antrihabitans sp. YC2-6]